MTPRPSLRLSRPIRTPGARNPYAVLANLLALLLPSVLLVFAGVRSSGNVRVWLFAGAGICIVLGAITYRLEASHGQNLLTMLPALAAIIWQFFSKADFSDPNQRLVQSILIVIAIGLFARQTLVASGGPLLRRARQLANRLASRRSWPESLDECRLLPEVEALREALTLDAGPALPLLSCDNPSVQIAALAAFESRKTWNYGQADQVLFLALSSPHPEIRAAAVLALSQCNQRLTVEALADTLRDPAPQVRQAAIESLLWDTEHRWIWIRHAVHDSLADPRFGKDGPLVLNRGNFSAAAITDLVAWSSESGILGTRATQTLGRHYSNHLMANPTPQLLKQLSDLVVSPKATTIMRLELANILIQLGFMTDELLEKMLNPENPSPLRLLAVESLLQSNRQEQAIDVLREVARQPNRELALTAATLVQKYLHVDLGLALGCPTPPLHSRQAAEVTRRVMEWANHAMVSAPVAAGNLTEW